MLDFFFQLLQFELLFQYRDTQHTNPYLHWCRSCSLPCCWPGSTFRRPEDFHCHCHCHYHYHCHCHCHCHCHFSRVFANQPDTQQKSNHQQRPLIIFFSLLASWALELVKIWSDPDQDWIMTWAAVVLYYPREEREEEGPFWC
jgi:hypothetical protein